MTRCTLIMILLAAALGSLLVVPASSEEVTLASVLAGKVAPLTVKYGEITPEWSQFMLAQRGDQLFSAIIMRQGGMNERMLSQHLAAYYTKGMSITCGGETYLLAYRQGDPIKMLLDEAIRRRTGESPDGDDELTSVVKALYPSKDTVLQLCLLNMKESGSLLDIRPADTQAALAASEKLFSEERERATEKAQQSQSMNNLRQLAVSLQMYTQENDEKLPTVKTVWNDINVPATVNCHPVTKAPYRFNTALSGKALGAIKNMAQVPAFYEGSGWSDGGHLVAYLDGHVEMLHAEAWARLQAKWKLP